MGNAMIDRAAVARSPFQKTVIGGSDPINCSSCDGCKMWQKILDDLEIGDKVEIDCGDTLIVGKFLRLFKSDAGKWMMEVQVKKRVELVTTKEIERLRVVR